MITHVTLDCLICTSFVVSDCNVVVEPTDAFEPSVTFDFGVSPKRIGPPLESVVTDAAPRLT